MTFRTPLNRPGHPWSRSEGTIGPKTAREIVNRAEHSSLAGGYASMASGANASFVIGEYQPNGFSYAMATELIRPSEIEQQGFYGSRVSTGEGVMLRWSVYNDTWHQFDPPPGEENPPEREYYHRFTASSASGQEGDYVLIANMHPGMWLWPNVTYKVITHQESGLVFPVDLPLQPVVLAKSFAAIEPSGSIPTFAGDLVNIYQDSFSDPFQVPNEDYVPAAPPAEAVGEPTKNFQIRVFHDWMAGATPIAANKEMLIQWFPEAGGVSPITGSRKGKWRIIQVEC